MFRRSHHMIYFLDGKSFSRGEISHLMFSGDVSRYLHCFRKYRNLEWDSFGIFECLLVSDLEWNIDVAIFSDL